MDSLYLGVNWNGSHWINPKTGTERVVTEWCANNPAGTKLVILPVENTKYISLIYQLVHYISSYIGDKYYLPVHSITLNKNSLSV